jgi:DtxR family Mn-dependent transcriptional regulator
MRKDGKEMLLEANSDASSDGVPARPPAVARKKGPRQVPLSELGEAEAGRIHTVITDGNMRRQLIALGFLPDVEVRVRKKLRSDSLLVRVKGVEIAIGKDVARSILVTPMVAK